MCTIYKFVAFQADLYSSFCCCCFSCMTNRPCRISEFSNAEVAIAVASGFIVDLPVLPLWAALYRGCLHGSVPEYLSRQLQRSSLWCPHASATVLFDIHYTRHSAYQSAPELSLLLRLQSGTACRKQSVLHHLWRCSESRWQRNCLHDPTSADWQLTTLTRDVLFCSVT